MSNVSSLVLELGINYLVLLLFIILSIYSFIIHDASSFVICIIGMSMTIIKFILIRYDARTLEN